MNTIALFDFTGTICDAYELIYSSLEKEALNSGFIRFPPKKPICKMGVKSLFKFFNIPGAAIKNTTQKVVDDIEGGIHDLPPSGDIVTTLKFLFAKGVKLYIASSNSEKAIVSFLKKNNLDIFSKIHSNLGKEGKAVISKQLLSSNPKSNIFVIGDEERDISNLPSATRIKSIGISWGFESPESWSIKPNYIAQTPKELLDIIYF